ncbi:MAG: hypothetical protein ACXU9G_08565, partial [Syntrophales bacterium]
MKLVTDGRSLGIDRTNHALHLAVLGHGKDNPAGLGVGGARCREYHGSGRYHRPGRGQPNLVCLDL